MQIDVITLRTHEVCARLFSQTTSAHPALLGFDQRMNTRSTVELAHNTSSFLPCKYQWIYKIKYRTPILLQWDLWIIQELVLAVSMQKSNRQCHHLWLLTWQEYSPRNYSAPSSFASFMDRWSWHLDRRIKLILWYSVGCLWIFWNWSRMGRIHARPVSEDPPMWHKRLGC